MSSKIYKITIFLILIPILSYGRLENIEKVKTYLSNSPRIEEPDIRLINMYKNGLLNKVESKAIIDFKKPILNNKDLADYLNVLIAIDTLENDSNYLKNLNDLLKKRESFDKSLYIFDKYANSDMKFISLISEDEVKIEVKDDLDKYNISELDIVNYLSNARLEWILMNLNPELHKVLSVYILNNKIELKSNIQLYDKIITNLLIESPGLAETFINNLIYDSESNLYQFEWGYYLKAKKEFITKDYIEAIRSLNYILIGGGPYEYSREFYYSLLADSYYKLGEYDNAYETLLKLYTYNKSAVNYDYISLIASYCGDIEASRIFSKLGEIR